MADDPDRAWAEIGDYLLLDAISYGEWNADRPDTASVSFATTVEHLKAERGPYQIITPEQASEYLGQGIPLALQPLIGGLPVDTAWRYLEAAAAVRPANVTLPLAEFQPFYSETVATGEA